MRFDSKGHLPEWHKVVDVYKLSLILGHNDIRTTIIYLHTATRELQKSFNVVEMF